MDWDFIIAMVIVGITVIWLSVKTILYIKKLNNVVKNKSDANTLCANCQLYNQCSGQNKADKLSHRVRIKDEK